MNTFDISAIVKNRLPCFFISPHFDDAVLSAGELMRYLAKTTCVTVINVFTKAGHTPMTESMKKMLYESDAATGEELYKRREIEDTKALDSMGVLHINLGFQEAMWRLIQNGSQLNKPTSPEDMYIYPTYEYHISSGHVSDLDLDTLNHISESLVKILPEHAMIWCPYGIGGHVDHVVTRKAVELMSHPYYYLDQPYVYRSGKNVESLADNPKKLSFWPIDEGNKHAVISIYESQITSLFGSSPIPNLEEYVLTPSWPL